MRQSPNVPDTQLFQVIVEKLDEGVIIFDKQGIVTYANDEAARLLDYPPHDLLDLDKEDFISLCHKDRLDGNRFARAFRSSTPDSGQPYEVITSSRRLALRMLTLEADSECVMILLLREIAHWRSDLIAQTVMAEMRKPLSFAANSCQTLNARLEGDIAHPFELQDLARIIHESVDRTLALWETLARLYGTDPQNTPELQVAPVTLSGAVQAALHELEQLVAHKLLEVVISLPEDLPPVRASPSHLHAALCALVEGAAGRLGPRDRLLISARDMQRYMQIDLTLEAMGSTMHDYLFDELPFAIAEQVIVQHGGRVWIEMQRGQPVTISCSLPIWSAEDSSD